MQTDWNGDVPFIPQPDRSPLITYQAGCLPKPSTDELRLVEVKYAGEMSHFALILGSVLLMSVNVLYVAEGELIMCVYESL